MKILLATDGSEFAHAGAALLERLPFPANSEVTVLRLTATLPADSGAIPPETIGEIVAELRSTAEGETAAIADRLAVRGYRARTEVLESDAAEGIVSMAEELDADLVVLGSRGLGAVERFLLGSVSDKVLGTLRRSLLLARDGDESAGKMAGPLRIVLAIDGSRSAENAVELLASIPFGDGAEITVLSVLELVTSFRMDIVQKLSPLWEKEKAAARDALERAAGRLKGSTSKVDTRLRESRSAGEAILDLADELDADLVVVGSHGRNALDRFLLGSTSKRVATHAGCSVLVCRDAEAGAGDA